MSCEADGCGLLPSFAPKGDRLPRTCSNHRGRGWVNVRSTTCFVDGCFKRPGFGLSKPVSCKEHSLPGYKSCVRHCEVETCSKQPSYGPPINETGKRKSYRCRNHAIAADVQNRDKRNKSYGLPAPQFRHLVPAGPAQPPAFTPIAPPPPANLPQPPANLPQPGAGLPQAPVPPPAPVPPAHPLPPPAADDPPAGDNATASATPEGPAPAAADVAEHLPPADLPDLGDEAPGEFPDPPDPPNPPTPTATAPIASPAQQDQQQPKQAAATKARRNVVVVDSAYRVDLGPVPTYTFTSTPRAVGRPFSGHTFVHASPPPMISLDRKRVADDHSTRAAKRQRMAGYVDDDESPDGGWAMGAAALTGGADGDGDGDGDDGSYSEYEYEYEYDDGEGL